MELSKEDLIAAYKIFLNRLPESPQAIQARLGNSAEKTLIEFMLSDEFLNRDDIKQLLTEINKTE